MGQSSRVSLSLRLFSDLSSTICLCVDGHQDDFCSHCVSVDEVERGRDRGMQYADLASVCSMYHASREHNSVHTYGGLQN